MTEVGAPRYPWHPTEFDHRLPPSFDAEKEINDVLNLAIAEELLKEIDPNITEAEVASVYEKCGGNPWNATIMYTLLKLNTNG